MKRVNYSERETVEVEGATFDLVPIPAHKWTELRLAARRALQRASRRALLTLKELGFEPTPERVEDEAWLDPEYRREYEGALRETVAWGVAGHTLPGVEFKGIERETFGRKYPGASMETVEAYADHVCVDGSRLLDALYVFVSRKNALTDLQKKS